MKTIEQIKKELNDIAVNLLSYANTEEARQKIFYKNPRQKSQEIIWHSQIIVLQTWDECRE